MPASPPPPHPSRIAGTDGLVLTEDHLFNLVDAAAPVTSAVRPPAPGRRLVCVGGGVVLAVFRSELEDNEPHVELEHWSFAPPDPEGNWEAYAEERLTVEGGRLTLASGVNALAAPHELAVPPGPYRLGVWCRGRAEARAAEPAAIDTGTLPRGVERWVVRLWPGR